jgi:hypothetical protein
MVDLQRVRSSGGSRGQRIPPAQRAWVVGRGWRMSAEAGGGVACDVDLGGS